MKSRLEAGYVAVVFGLIFLLTGFLGNIAANFIYDMEKGSIWFGISIFVSIFAIVTFMYILANFIEKKLKK